MANIINHHGNVEEVSDHDTRWQEHYDDYLASLDGRGGICARDAAEQYADDMMDEELAAPRKPYVPSAEYLAWLEEIDGGPDPLRHLEPRRKVA